MVQFAAVQEGLQNILLGVAEIGSDLGKPLPHRGQVLHAFEDSAKVGDVVGGHLDSVDSTKLGVAAAYVVFQNTVFEQCPQDRLAKMKVLQSGLEPAIVLAGNPLTKDHRHLVGTAEFAVGVQESVMQSVQNSSLPKDQVVAEFHLFEIKAMFAAQIIAFVGAEKGDQAVGPLSAARRQVLGRERIGNFL